MRFVPIQSVKKNSILGKKVYGEDGQVLLQKGVQLTQKYIDRLMARKINGVYIDCEFSKDVEIVNVISDQLRNRAVQDVKKLFTFTEKDLTSSENIRNENMKNIYGVVEDIVDQILNCEHTLFNLVDLKLFDDYTFHHSVNTAVVSVTIGAAMHMDRKRLFKLGLSGILHDIGKTFIPEEVLNKNGKLNAKEWKQMKEHPYRGYRHLKDNYPNIPSTSLAGILHHHERWNGEGYPSGKEAEEIFEFGRIIAVADVYDALTSDRPYRKALYPHEAIEYIMSSAEEYFDLEVVKKFTENIAPYPLGTIVKLSDQRTGIVIENNAGFGLRPIIKIIKDVKNKVIPEQKRKIIDLKENINLTIIEVCEV
jgi:HD-GYP domain-containing protein (c-di-GMP phosphodiesterase class II)